MKKKNANYFFKKEQKFQENFALFRTKFFKPLLFILTRLKIAPSFISFLSIVSVFGFVYLVPRNIYHAWIFIIIHIFLDGIDGSLARYQKKASVKGGIIDMIVDQGGFIIITTALIYFNLIDPLWALLYIVSYTLMVIMMAWLNLEDKPTRFVFRSRLLFYLLIILDPYFQTKITMPFLIVFSLYQTINLFFLLKKIKPQSQKY